MNSKAVFIGRFQPLHLGHLDAIENILRQGYDLIIVIGSIQEKGTQLNPFSFEQRKDMLKKVFDQENITTRVLGVKDFESDAQWAAAITQKVGSFDLVVSGNEHVLEIFSSRGIKTQKVRFTITINATQIREMVKNNNNQWQEFVPKVLHQDIKEILG